MRKPSNIKHPASSLNVQPTLFGYIKPTGKVPISAARIQEAKALFAAGKPKEARPSYAKCAMH